MVTPERDVDADATGAAAAGNAGNFTAILLPIVHDVIDATVASVSTYSLNVSPAHESHVSTGEHAATSAARLGVGPLLSVVGESGERGVCP